MRVWLVSTNPPDAPVARPTRLSLPQFPESGDAATRAALEWSELTPNKGGPCEIPPTDKTTASAEASRCRHDFVVLKTTGSSSLNPTDVPTSDLTGPVPDMGGVW